MFHPTPPTNFSLHPIIFRIDCFTSFKNDFMNSGFIILEVKKLFQNKYSRIVFWSSRFLILETPFLFETSPILESPKTIKDNLGILKNVEVQEEKCRSGGRNTLDDLLDFKCS